ncbi:TetR/AcrR family transcriptional regulator [Alteromonas sp. CYL-A6]|uniref:TetR/AcrR family transcriptional regulator n=1 Tax=Alteromonas nitratireducens TaxID=3390813 RepID=UPI0034A6F9E1
MSETKPARVGRPKSEEKRRQILTAASALFLREGFANTSMDSVAKASGVSKQTVYSHFPSKDTLFQAAITAKCQSYDLDPTDLAGHDHCDLPMTQCLRMIGTQFVRLIQDPEVVAMFRVVISEARNNPRIAELFYQAGPKASLDGLAPLFMAFSDNQLSTQDANAMARDFFSLLKGELHIMLLCDLIPPLNNEQIERHVEQAVEKTSLLMKARLQQ